MSQPIWRPLTQMATAPAPLRVVGGSGAWMHLEDGREVLNCVSSWWQNIHGHANPTLAKAIYDQALAIEHVNFADFTHQPAEDLADRLVALTPPNLTTCLFSDNGSTSVEVALKLALQYWHNLGTPKTGFIQFEGGYHGETFGAMSASGNHLLHRPFAPLFFPTDSLPFPTTVEAEEATLTHLKTLLATESHAAIIIEPLIQGAGGMRLCRPEFLQKMQQAAGETLIIYDEVMTGFGRTGEWFSATLANTQPDILCLSKGITGGYLPLAVTMTTDRIYNAFLSDSFDKTFAHTHSYSGSALGCAAANASLDLLTNEPFRKFAPWHEKRLYNLPNTTNHRILGTLAAFEVETKDKSGYLNPIGATLKAKLLARGIYMRPLGNTFFFLPPYCMTEDELDHAYTILAEELQTC